MTTDIEIYLEDTLPLALKRLTASDSPLMHEKVILDYFALKQKEGTLEGKFTLCPSDSMIFSDGLHMNLQYLLKFKPASQLHYERCILDVRKAKAFRDISTYLESNDMPFYMSAVNELGHEDIICGANPKRNIKIANPRFEKKVDCLIR